VNFLPPNGDTDEDRAQYKYQKFPFPHITKHKWPSQLVEGNVNGVDASPLFWFAGWGRPPKTSLFPWDLINRTPQKLFLSTASFFFFGCSRAR